MTPDRRGLVTQALDTYLRNRLEDRPTALGTDLRGSWAWDCSRRIAFELAGTPKDRELDLPSMLTFAIGQFLHDLAQDALAEAGHDRSEVAVDLRPLGYDVSGHADLTLHDGTVVMEIKSQAGYGFLKAAGGSQGRQRFAGDGPDPKHVCQAAIYALGAGADKVHIVYLAKDKGRWPAEWTIGLDDPLPAADGATPRALAIAELDRMEQIRSDVESGVLPARWAPEFGLIEQVGKHVHDTYTDSNPDGAWPKPFICGGCPFNDTCRELPAEPVPLDVSDAA